MMDTMFKSNVIFIFYGDFLWFSFVKSATFLCLFLA